MIKRIFCLAVWGCIRPKPSHPLIVTHRVKTWFCIFADRWRRFVGIFDVFCQFYKLHPIFQVYLAYKPQLENAWSALGPACMLLSLFVLHQKLFKSGSWNFCRDAVGGGGGGGQAFVERVLEGTPSPKSHAPFPRGMWLR